MQVGAQDRNKLIVAIVLMVLALGLMGRWLFSSESSSSAGATATPPPAVPSTPVPRRARGAGAKRSDAETRSLDPTLRYDWLKASEDTEYKGSGRNIFRAEVVVSKPILPRAPKPVVNNTPPQPPPPPPIELKFFGFASKPGEPKRVFLSQGEDVFVAGEGDIVDRRYKILRISPTSVEVEDVLNNHRQEIQLTQA
jgi:hypothetical protein